MRNFFASNKPLKPKPIPHSGPSEPQPDEEPIVQSTDSEEESSDS
jgi:hypothetical protein